MNINPDIFREYDIRGVYPKEINGAVAREIGVAFVKFLKKKPPDGKDIKIAIGRDSRSSAPKLEKNFIRGAIGAGADIIDLGPVTSPMLYFAVSFLKTNGGAMITASHNPKNYNGIKIIRDNGMPVSGKEIKKFISNKKVNQIKKGAYKKLDIKKKYFDKVYENFDLRLMKKIKIPHSFDYDRDRLFVRGKNKKDIRGDIIGTIIGDAIAQKGDSIVCDLRCSRAVTEYFRNKGVKTLPCKNGHSNIKKKMREKKAVFGMELSGHYFFKKFNYHESPKFALRKITEQLNSNPKLNLSEPYPVFKKFYHSGIINLPAKGKNFKTLEKKLREDYGNGAQNALDGLTVEFSNWWFNIQPSNTEPLIRLAIEANSPKLLEQKKKELMDKIKKIF